MPNKNIYIIILILLFSCSDTTSLDYRNNLITDAIGKVSPSVVGVTIKSKKNSSSEFGSGLSINKDGYIITNAHVVEFADNIIITTMGGKKYPAEIIGMDKLTDVALLKIQTEDIIFSKFDL